MDRCDQTACVLSVLLGTLVILVLAGLVIFHKRFTETGMSKLKYELRKEKQEKEDALSRFTETGMSKLKYELRKEKQEKEDALSRFTETGMSKLKYELRKEKQEKEDALSRLQVIKREVMTEKSKLQCELTKEKQEKEDAISRLSIIMSSRLKDGYFNVEGLGDQNRPTKLGEQFSELYDNQWTETYGALGIFFEDTKEESEIIQILLEILKKCFTICNDRSRQQLEELEGNVSDIATLVTKGQGTLRKDFIQRIKEERKLYAYQDVPDLAEFLSILKNDSTELDRSFLDGSHIKAFVQECLKLSWLMVIQDPPMAMLFTPVSNTHETFRAYQHRGTFIEYIVWPALLLQEGGPVVMKGFAEFTSVSSNTMNGTERNVQLSTFP